MAFLLYSVPQLFLLIYCHFHLEFVSLSRLCLCRHQLLKIRQYSTHWIQRLASVKGFEVIIDSTVAMSRPFSYKMAHFIHRILAIATSTGRCLLHKGRNLLSLQPLAKVAIYVLKEVRLGDRGRYTQRSHYIEGRYIQWALYVHTCI